jgi:hypothetical protein
VGRGHRRLVSVGFVDASSPFPQMEGCDEVPFKPQIALAPTTQSADSPTGLDVNPAGADGLAACSPDEIELRGDEPARCPDASKIGTVEVGSPLLERDLKGGVYVAASHDNPFDSLLAIYIAVDDPQTGIVVKLAGEVEADKATGQLTTTFDQNPQLPFEDFRLRFFDGPRAALKTGATCGTFTTKSDLTPWTAPEGANVTPSSSFTVTSGPNGSPCIDSADQEPNRPLNPTSCEPMQVAATALSSLGQAAALSNRFQVGGCDALPFAPKLALTLIGRTRRAADPALKAVLTAQPGEANIAAAQVTLPHSEFIDQDHLQNICTRVQFNEGGGNGERCPAASVYGFAKADTPLLDRPLEGPVYLRSSTHELPDLVAALGGQINVVLAGHIDSVKGRLRSTFEVVPDAPVGTFTLEMQGGAKGLLTNSTNLCRQANPATANFFGQNGKVSHAKPVLKVSCRRKKHRRSQ